MINKSNISEFLKETIKLEGYDAVVEEPASGPDIVVSSPNGNAAKMDVFISNGESIEFRLSTASSGIDVEFDELSQDPLLHSFIVNILHGEVKRVSFPMYIMHKVGKDWSSVELDFDLPFGIKKYAAYPKLMQQAR